MPKTFQSRAVIPVLQFCCQVPGFLSCNVAVKLTTRQPNAPWSRKPNFEDFLQMLSPVMSLVVEPQPVNKRMGVRES